MIFISSRRIALAFFLSALSVTLASCSRKPHVPVVAVIETTGGTAYWNTFADTVRAQGAARGFSLKWYAPQSAADYEVQAASLNDAIQKKVDGIILTPSHQLVLAEGVRRAHAEGIPVVIVDGSIAVPPTDYATSIACSNEAIGFMAAQGFAGRTDTLHILTVGSSPTLESTAQREASLKKALQRIRSNDDVVQARYSLSDWARSRQITLDALNADPNINAIFSSDDFTTHGVLTAVKSMKGNRSLAVIGVQNDPESQDAIRSGLMQMSISCDSASEARLAVDAMQRVLMHQPVEKLIQTEILSFTKANVPPAPVR